MAAATKPTTADYLICMEAHCNPNTEPPSQVVLYESEWAPDDPVVAAAPNLFISKEAPRSAWKTPFDTAVARNDENSRQLEEQRKAAFDRMARQNEVKLEQPKYVVLKKEFVGEFEGQPATLKRGSALPENHPFVLANRDLFG